MYSSLQRIRVGAANLLWFAYATVRAIRWQRAARDVAGAQAAALRRILTANAATEFGRARHFAAIATPADYQRAAPLATYEDMRPSIERAAAAADGQGGRVLTAQPITHFALTSGSTQAAKLIPYTSALVSEFQEGIAPWVHYLMRQHPQMLLGKTYWSVTPVGEERRRTSGGVSIGFDDERQYLDPITRSILNTVMVNTANLAGIDDMEAFRYTTLRLLLQERLLSWVSIWNPSFFTLLLEPLAEWLPRLITDIRRGTLDVAPQIAVPLRELLVTQCARAPQRASELQQIAARWQGRPPTERVYLNHTLYEAIWPELRLISCWAHGNAAQALPPLQACFPGVAIQPKGLLATEAFVSFPFTGDLSALSLLSHFFEFEEITDDGGDDGDDDEAAPTIQLAHELEVGRRYAIIVTTGGGLYRYRLNDLIEVADFHHQCPLVRFVGRQSKVVDVCGEKLHEDFVQTAIAALLAKHDLRPSFWTVAPECPSDARPYYTLFMQFAAETALPAQMPHTLAAEADQALKASYHYNYCRRLGQLAGFRLFVIAPHSNAYHTYMSVCADLGQRLGDIKPTALHPFQHWSARYTGHFA
jgi:hypothetical protein